MSIVALVVLAIALVLVLAALKPATFSVRRSALIEATPERVFALLDDFHHWPQWSPWEGRDPDMRREHAGARRGPGAIYSWSGNRQVGEGRMEITRSEPPSRLDIRLDFLKPFEAHNRTVFILRPVAGGTEIDWEMSGPAHFTTRLMQVFMPMDRMVGKDFEEGLARLREAAEAPAVVTA